MNWSWELPFDTLIGKILSKIEVLDDVIDFYTVNNEHYRLEHEQECCENVYLESIVGDWKDFIGYPILKAEETSGDTDTDEYGGDSCRHTFYKLATIKGFIDIRWYGCSNGYYGVGVSLKKKKMIQ